MRTQWIRQELLKRLGECSDAVDYSLLVATFNANDRMPPTVATDLDGWLIRPDLAPPDVVVVGLQEMDLGAASASTGDALPASYPEGKEFRWLNILHACVNQRDQYERIHVKRLVGLMVVVFVRATHSLLRENVRSVSSATVSCGLLGVMGNKGAVAIRLRIFNHAIVFVNAHLAAHAGYYQRRCQDYRTIRDNVRFPPDLSSSHSSSLPTLTEFVFDEDSRVDLADEGDNDLVVWLGDLNFRTEMDSQEARSLAQHGRYDVLLQRDQLARAIADGDAFAGFQEVPVMFPPTFKYDVGSVDTFDTSDKQRCPSWTDRVVWKVNNNEGLSIEPKAYWMWPELAISDHKPVSVMLTVHSQHVQLDRLSILYAEVLKAWDSQENARIPQTALDNNVIDLGELFMQCHVERTVTLQGVGPFDFEVFVQNQQREQVPALSWLRISPMHGHKVQRPVRIGLRADLDGQSAFDFNYDRVALDRTFVVVSVKGGQDHFVALEASWRPSVFARRLEDYAVGEDKQLPLPLLCLLDTLSATNPSERAFFDEPDGALLASIIAQLDAGAAKLSFDLRFALADVYIATCQALLMWLESIPFGRVIPRRFDPLLAQAAYERRPDYVLDSLEPLRRTIFSAVMAFLRRHRQAVQMSANGKRLSYLCKLFSLAIFEDVRNGLPTDSTDFAAPSTPSADLPSQLYKTRAKFIKQFLIG